MDFPPGWSDPCSPHTEIGKEQYVFIVAQERKGPIFRTPHEPCTECQDSFYTDAEQEERYPEFAYRGEVSREEATRIATEYTQNAQNDRDALSQLLRDHGDLLISRWKKKSPAKRAAILIAASPELNQDDWVYSLYHRLRECCWEAARDPVARIQLLLPWLTLSILKSNPSALFALLHHRSAFAPQEWAPYDNKQLTLSWSYPHFDLQFTTLCVVMHGPAYGRQVVDFDPDALHRQDIIGFPRARLILEAQAYLLKFLRKTVDAILATVEQPAGSENWLSVVGAGLGHAGQELGYRSTYAHQAYSKPPSFETSLLLSICEVRMNALEDHLNLLQTDPQYMKRHVQIFQQGKMYELKRFEQRGWMLYNALFKEVITYWRWKWLKAECQHVESLQVRFRDSICQGQPLPTMYAKALGALQLFVLNLANWRATNLREQLARRPGFSSYFTYTSMEGGEKFETKLKPHQRCTTKLYEQDPLFWCLIQLTGDMTTQGHFDHGHLFAFLEQHILTCSAQDRNRIDGEILRTVSDLVAYFEILMNVRLHRPFCQARELAETMSAEDRGAWLGWNALNSRPSPSIIRMQREMGNKLFDKMTSSSPYPLDKTMQLERAKSMRACLETFWGDTRKTVKILFQVTRLSAAEISSLTEVISANLAPEYLDEVRLEEGQLLGKLKPVSRQLELRTEWDMSPTEAKSSSATATQQKIKVKTKLIGPQLPEAHEVLAVPTETEPSPKVIPVSKRSLQILRLMYPIDTEERVKGVDWPTFVRTMADTGFVTKDAGGSAVSFENQDGGKIIFHKPHPDTDVDAHLLRIMAWRMRKRFGWVRDGFVLKG